MPDRNLTPIKIPGKRRHDCRQDEVKIATDGWPRSSLPGRRPKTKPFRTSITTTELHKKRRSLRNIKHRRRMAILESLPTEVLEKIFLFSLCFSLPHASPIIARKLSSHRMYVEATKAAFGPTWDHDYRCIKDQSLASGRDPKYPSVVVPGDHNIQSSLLRCRWATLDILRQVEAEWLREAETSMDLAPLVSVYGPGNDGSRRWHMELKDDMFGKDYQHFRDLKLPILNSALSNVEYRFKQCTSGFLLIHPRTGIPDSLLKGPWTEEMTKHLFWFMRAGAKIGWTDSTSGEVALRGLREAIKTGNEDILFIFQQSTVAQGMTSEDILWSVENAGGNTEEVLQYVASMYMAMMAGCNDRSCLFSHVNTLGCIQKAVSLRRVEGGVLRAKRIMAEWMKSVEREISRIES